jgi:hypothetical protein
MSDSVNKNIIEDLMGYDKLVEQALKSVVKKVLVKVEEEGLKGEHHFYITFDTRQPGVEMPVELKEKYKKEMTIVLQHQFYNLNVNLQDFVVKLAFNGINQTIKIPFRAITVFADPSVNFMLQFHHNQPHDSKILQEEEVAVKDEEIQEVELKNNNNVVELDFKNRRLK